MRNFKKMLALLLGGLLIFFGGGSAVFAEETGELSENLEIVAENANMKLYFNEDTALIGIENKQNHYIWWSSPLNAEQDSIATKPIMMDLLSSVVLTYGDSSSQSITNLRSRNSADITVNKIEKGILVTYQFEKCGVTIPISYTLEQDYLSVSVNCDKIQETLTDKGILATQLNIMGAFGAGSSDEDGYFLIPDGCGALIRFHNGKENAKSYSAKVYGRDITSVPNSKPPSTEKIYLPVFGIVKEHNAMTVIIEKGDGNATLNANVSGQSLSSFNLCSFSFNSVALIFTLWLEIMEI